MLEQEGYILKWLFLLFCAVGFLLHSVVSFIPLGSKLSVLDNNLWVSPNGNFAFGFYNRSDQPNQYSIGVRFNSRTIPPVERIAVWIVGADIMVGNSSYFQFTKDGELVLFESLKGVRVWKSGTAELSVATAALSDDGNLVLFNDKKDIVWQSFDNHSDTLLPGQKLSNFQSLRAASKNLMSSYYTLFLDSSGQLQLRWDSNVIYWTSNIPSSSNVTALLTSDGVLQLRDDKQRVVWSVFGEDHNESVHYRYLRIDIDGNFRLYSWSDGSQSWRAVWQAVENQCNVFATCGQRGICVFNASESPDCKCPFQLTNGYMPKCLIPHQDQCASGTDMVTYVHMSLYEMFPPNDDLVSGINLHECESLCLSDRHCTAATFTNDGTARCFLKKTPYVSGRADPSLSSVSFVKRCADPLAVDPSLILSSPQPSPQRGSSKICTPCLIGAASGTFVIFFAVQLILGFYIYKRRISQRKKVSLAYTNPYSKGLVVLSFSEIKEFTRNFENQIGSTMFKGKLPNNKPVVIKDLKGATIEERKYRVAVSKIGSIHHKNLVKLEGYCCESTYRFLIFEYVKNGSLQNYIEDPKLCKKLTWAKRVQICSSVARAICYLHTNCREFVCHGSLKCGNVVLDENLEAKVTEFGLQRITGETLCFGSAERDVEDFGKMVLTLISGGCKENGDLCEWTYNEWNAGRASNIVDERISGGVDSEELERVLRIAFWCLQINGRVRPSMKEVVIVLEGKSYVDSPPPPFALQGAMEIEETLDSGSEV